MGVVTRSPSAFDLIEKVRTTILVVRSGGAPSMCDYSLHLVASRPAKVGDKLVTTKFSGSITRGFTAVGEPTVAVCLLPGTEIAFEKEVLFDSSFGWFLDWKHEERIAEKVARFRQVNTDQQNVHHDALEFPSGETVLLTRLYEGQQATVLQLPAVRVVTEEEKQKHVSGVV
jgi:hypothetical protein